MHPEMGWCRPQPSAAWSARRRAVVTASLILTLGLAGGGQTSYTVVVEEEAGETMLLENTTGCSILCVPDEAAVSDGTLCFTDEYCWYHKGCVANTTAAIPALKAAYADMPAGALALALPFNLSAVRLDSYQTTTACQSSAATTDCVTEHRMCVSDGRVDVDVFGPGGNNDTDTIEPEGTLCLPDTPGEQDFECMQWRGRDRRGAQEFPAQRPSVQRRRAGMRCGAPCIINCTRYEKEPKEFEVDLYGYCCLSNGCAHTCAEYKNETTEFGLDCDDDDLFGNDNLFNDDHINDDHINDDHVNDDHVNDDAAPATPATTAITKFPARASCCDTNTCSDPAICTAASTVSGAPGAATAAPPATAPKAGGTRGHTSSAWLSGVCAAVAVAIAVASTGAQGPAT